MTIELVLNDYDSGVDFRTSLVLNDYTNDVEQVL